MKHGSGFSCYFGPHATLVAAQPSSPQTNPSKFYPQSFIAPRKELPEILPHF